MQLQVLNIILNFQACEVKIIDFGAYRDNRNRVRNTSFTFDIKTGKLVGGHEQEQQVEFDYLKNGYWAMISNSRYPQSKEGHKEKQRNAKTYYAVEYDLESFNCEHFVLKVLTGEVSSKQVKELLLLFQ